MNIAIHNLNKSYEGKPVLQKVSMNLEQRELVSIVGPSGVGKTTLLRILAELEVADSGEIQKLPQEDAWQPTIMVFQDFMLFPHINVHKNIAYGLESQLYYNRLFPDHAEITGSARLSQQFRRLRRKRINDLVEEFVHSFALKGLEHKFPAQLSAGQKQRVALARAIIIKPALLLLDEPFANLDQNLKMETALFIREVQQRHAVSVLAVTHDLQEAFAMSDRIGVMLQGTIQQMSDVETLYRFPINADVGQFLGAINVVPESIWPSCEFVGQMPTSTEEKRSETASAQNKHILVRAESLEPIADNAGSARILKKRFQGMLIHLELELEGHKLIAYSLSSELVVGQKVRVRIRDFVEPQTQ